MRGGVATALTKIVVKSNECVVQCLVENQQVHIRSTEQLSHFVAVVTKQHSRMCVTDALGDNDEITLFIDGSRNNTELSLLAETLNKSVHVDAKNLPGHRKNPADQVSSTSRQFGDFLIQSL